MGYGKPTPSPFKFLQVSPNSWMGDLIQVQPRTPLYMLAVSKIVSVKWSSKSLWVTNIFHGEHYREFLQCYSISEILNSLNYYFLSSITTLRIVCKSLTFKKSLVLYFIEPWKLTQLSVLLLNRKLNTTYKRLRDIFWLINVNSTNLCHIILKKNCVKPSYVIIIENGDG